MPSIPTDVELDRLAGLSAKELKDELRAARTRRTKGVREGLDPAPLLDPEVWALETEQARRAAADAAPGASAAPSPLPPVGEAVQQGADGADDKVAQLTASVLELSTACTASRTAHLALEGQNMDLTADLEDSRREVAVLRAEVQASAGGDPGGSQARGTAAAAREAAAARRGHGGCRACGGSVGPGH